MRRFLVTVTLLFVLVAIAGLRWRRGGGLPGPSWQNTDELTDGSVHAPSEPVVGGEGGARVARPFVVAAVDWELLMPVAVAGVGAEGDPPTTFAAAGVPTQVLRVGTYRELERAMARGGGNPGGADIAFMPLSSFILAQERLGALALEVFFVVASAGGGYGVAAADPTCLTRLGLSPPTGGVQFVGNEDAPETFLGLSLLQAAGVPVQSVQVVAPGGKTPAEGALQGIDARSRPATAPVLATTRHAPGLDPYVAVAPQRILRRRSDAIEYWLRAWLQARDVVVADADRGSARLRQLMESTGATTDAPLLNDLQFHSLADNAELFGLAGRRAADLHALFERGWELWHRRGRLRATRAPVGPLNATAIVQLAQGGAPRQSVRQPSSGAGAKASAGTAFLVHLVPEQSFDPAAFIAQVAYLAEVFPAATLHVHAPAAPGGKHISALAVARYGLREGRVAQKEMQLAGRPAGIEVVFPEVSDIPAQGGRKAP